MGFHAVVERGARAAAAVQVPEAEMAALGPGRRHLVVATVNGHTYRTSVGWYLGAFRLPLSAEHRDAAGVSVGDEVEVVLELDTAPRTVDVPADLAAALDAEPAARRAFDAMPHSHRRAYVEAVEEARRPQTRTRRIEQCVSGLARLSAGR